MRLIEVAKDVFIAPEEVVSVEHDVVKEYCSSSPSDTSMYDKFNGTRITLKNGRKVFINTIMPKQILFKLGMLGPDLPEEE